MDYEKKYKEALDWIRDLYPTMEGGVKEDAEHYFPELKESKDERVRKMIIYQMERWHEAAIENNVVKDIKDSADAIAWLEKQGEQKPNYCHHEVDLSNCSEEYRKAYYDGWNNCNQQHEQLKAEQKPAWSEDDEERYLSCLKRLGTGDIRQQETINTVWLKSVKNRIQPKQEWSEKDEAGLGDALWAIQQARTIAKDENDMGNLWYAETWLKSLKDKFK